MQSNFQMKTLTLFCRLNIPVKILINQKNMKFRCKLSTPELEFPKAIKIICSNLSLKQQMREVEATIPLVMVWDLVLVSKSHMVSEVR